MPAVIGLDFGTESVRALLLDAERGEIIGTAARSYADGVIDRVLPGGEEPLPPEWALQNPDDWLLSMADVVAALMADTGYPSDDVIGLGVDFTSCTILPVAASGKSLCSVPDLRTNPHAWPKLWKHHAAQPQADRINRLASESGVTWLPRYGGKISSEWLLPKALEILEDSPEVYESSDLIMEGADWVVLQLTGALVRNSCACGYKALWHARDGFPSDSFIGSLDSRLTDLYTKKLAGTILPPGHRVGLLLPEWCSRMRLSGDVWVGSPIIDAHAAAIGGGSSQSGDMFMIMGTSTCHMLLGDKEELVPGIAGVVQDGIISGLFGYEAGQAASGDSLAWFVDKAVPASDSREAVRRGVSLHEYLSELAARIEPGGHGLLALDWFNGNRSTLVDSDLSGLILGITLGTRPEEIYRALIEATAFGTRVIVDAFENSGLRIKTIRAGGSLAGNQVAAQIYADVLGREMLVVDSPEVSARGAAILGAAAAGSFESVSEAASKLGTRIARTFVPRAEAHRVYEELFIEYVELYDYFGRGGNPVMKTLRRLKRSSES